MVAAVEAAPMRKVLSIGLLITTFSLLAPFARADDPLAWPIITQQNRPWTRWWWMGSAVDKDNLSRLLQQYHDAGVGGVEICPIYGATGYEKRYIPFLSPKWMEMLDHATATANRLGMGFDMTTGTGWPMGGPWIAPTDASSTMAMARFDLQGGGGPLNDDLILLPSGRVQCVEAVRDNGQTIDITDKMKDWVAPAGNWRIYAIVQRGPVMKVKRAAPGGEGSVIDPFSTKAMDDYLAWFDKAFAGYKGRMPRAQFHDSYEYVGNWTNDLFEKFRTLRGYDLRTQLPALRRDADSDTVARVLCDYRQTMADLHSDYVNRWVQWSHAHGMLAREQAHGAPANLLDLYAEADIPETETFGSVGVDQNMPMNKFASSAAHVTGKQLASSESFTWLGEHFQVSLADVKPVADYLFLSGINHILFHGMAYSPQDVPWPGWLFYASVDFNPNGGLWHDLPAFNAYVARCQSILQSGKPSNDLLLYFPVYDLWQTPRGTLIMFNIAGQWLRANPFYPTALQLAARGFGVDYFSDAQIASATVANGSVILGGNAYKAIVLPPCRVMPPATMAKLIELAKAGATIIVKDALPSDVPGLADRDIRAAELRLSLKEIPITQNPTQANQGAPVGNGYVWVGKDLNLILDAAGAQREPMVDLGLHYIRRLHEEGYQYFIANRGQENVDGWVTLATQAKSAVILDPLYPDRVGVAALRNSASGAVQVYLQLQPGETCFLRTYATREISGPAWLYGHPAGDGISVNGLWTVHFLEGGPQLPADFQTSTLASWTLRDDAQAKRFAGTARYSIDFDAPAATDYVLDLGKVCQSARVRINGQDVGTLFAQPFAIRVGSYLRAGRNHLELDVTNLSANRIADLDRRGVKWKSFHEINFVGRDYRPFDASHWPLRDSGLLGPVRLIPMAQIDVTQ
jgi:alpha-L-rhamnosidase